MSACRALTVRRTELRGEGYGIRMAQIDSPWAPLGEGTELPEGSLKDSAGLEIGKSSVGFFSP